MTDVSSEGPFPESVLSLLKKAKFVHLATCKDGFPRVSLMNYTYIPSSETYTPGQHPVIALSTHTCTQKYDNIRANPHVSLLVHDWVTANSVYKEAIEEEAEEGEEGESDHSRKSSVSSQGAPSKLFQMLQGLNQNELSSVSATLSGEAVVLLDASDEKNFYKRKMLQANPDAKPYIDGDDIAIILVTLTKSKVADIQNNISEYS